MASPSSSAGQGVEQLEQPLVRRPVRHAEEGDAATLAQVRRRRRTEGHVGTRLDDADPRRGEAVDVDELGPERLTGGDEQVASAIEGSIERSLQRRAGRRLADPARWLVEHRGEGPVGPPRHDPGGDRPGGDAVHDDDATAAGQRVLPAGERHELDGGVAGRRGLGHPPVVQVPAGQLRRRPAGHQRDDERRPRRRGVSRVGRGSHRTPTGTPTPARSAPRRPSRAARRRGSRGPTGRTPRRSPRRRPRAG